MYAPRSEPGQQYLYPKGKMTMKSLKTLILGLLAIAISVGAYAQTTITATVQDATSTVWSNAPYRISYAPTTQAPDIAGQALFIGKTNGSGVLSVAVPGAFQGTGRWLIQVCANASPNQKPCAVTTVTVSGGSQDISTAINAVTIPPVVLAGPNAYAYND